jgi:Ca2+-binding RTX toxin-like protein
LAGAGNDTIIVGGSQTFSSSYQAVNTSSTTQVGTGDKVTLEGMLRVEDVIDGGADTDTIELGKGNVAFFLHDAFSGFHSSVQLSSDSTGEQSKARLENIEQITGNDSDVNLIDLTSPDYSLDRQSITVDGAGGRDIIWGSDADEIIIGGDGDDELFGGAGTNVLTGGAGADEFQFTMTSENDSVTDFNAAEGDTLKFFNTGGATFDRDSVTANSEGDGISIEYSHNDQVQSLNISLGLSSSSVTNDLLSAIEII